MSVNESRVAVIGGGWAGCAAAVALAEAGCTVELIEAAPQLGGRARRVMRQGLTLDNGLHLVLGAYRETRWLLAQLHDRPPVSWTPLSLAPFAIGQPGALTLRAWRVPAPFNLLLGILCARGLRASERITTLRWFARLRSAGYRCDPAQTVAELTASLPPIVADQLWHPLCLAALNTPPRQASAQVFANVLRAAFGEGADGSDVMHPHGDLGTLVGDAARQWLAARGHRVDVRAAARVEGAVAREGGAVAHGGGTAAREDGTAARGGGAAACGDGMGTPTRNDHAAPMCVRIGVQDSTREFSGAVVAVAPHQLARAFAPSLIEREPALRAAIAQVDALAWEPITTVYLGYAQRIDLPDALIRLDDQPGQWLFMRADIVATAGANAPPLASVVAVVLSAHGPHDLLGRDALAAAVDAQLRARRAGWPALAWSQVIEEKRATYACTPSAKRPVAGMLFPGVALAGDYTDEAFPATLEAAVRSGRRAAAALVATLR